MDAALGCISAVDEQVMNLVAGSAVFQQWVAAPDAAGARARVFLKGYAGLDSQPRSSAGEMQSQRPCAMIAGDEDSAYSWELTAETFWQCSGLTVIVFEDDVPAELADNLPALDRWFKNWVGQVVDDMKAAANQGGTLFMVGVQAGEVDRTPQEYVSEIGDIVSMEIRIAWGLPS